MYSSNGVNWASASTLFDKNNAILNQIFWNQSIMVAVGTNGANVLMTSPDGINWTIYPTPFDGGSALSVAYAPPDLWVIGGALTEPVPQKIVISTNGKNWVQPVSTPFDTTGQVLGLLGPLFYTVTTPSTPPFPAWVSGEGAGMIAAL
jgi:hypothetical protein